MSVPGLVIAAPASGAGKTTITLGILRALRQRGVDVAPAKSGPDYIDPGFHAAAAGRPSATLDAWAMAPARLRTRAAARAELLVIEGAMGLFDGADDGSPGGTGSTADVAAALDIPVVLVVDARRAGQGLAATVAGLARWRPDVRIAGVILNRTGSARHATLVARSVERVAPVLGSVPEEPALATPSRHLGLVQAQERADLEAFLAAAATAVAGAVDLDRLTHLARPARAGEAPPALSPPGQRVALARDVAFGFAYPHMLADWRAAGAEILPFSPLADEPPDPTADAVFLPGGYPELHAPRLAAANRFLQGLRAAALRAARVHGECGGYMTLGETLIDADGTPHAMAGLLPLVTSFAAPRRHLGYRCLHPLDGGGALMAHEFHYATTVEARGPALFRAFDAAGRDLGETGLAKGRVTGSFAHVIEAA